MNKREILLKCINIIGIIGIAITSIGIGAYIQAQHDVTVLNQSLDLYSKTNAILTDGVSYYSIVRYENKLNYSTLSLLNYSECKAMYGSIP